MAHYIQHGLLSAKYPEHKEVQIYATNLPCRAVGGDFYNFIAYDDDKLGVVVGDVSGKGIPAALLMTMTNSIFTEFGKRFSSPEQILQHANQSLLSFLSKSPLFYVTAFYGMIHFKTNLLKYGKAGHNPPILYQAKKDKCSMLDAEGTYLGTFDDCGLIEKTIPIENGDKLVLYTDGITEIRNNKNQLFGKERLAAFVKANPSLPAEKLAKFLISEVGRWGDHKEFADDITLVVIDFIDLKTIKETPQFKIDDKIENTLSGIKKTVSSLLKKLEALEINKRVYNHIRLALSEALMNAMEHGNNGDASKSIHVKGVITTRRFEVVVTDEGAGFDLHLLQMKENQVDINHRGRGITAIKGCMDEVHYNEAGNALTLVKYIQS
jgi:sigma-B regulation protein RsbU (phosphoserine phosphatase)